MIVGFSSSFHTKHNAAVIPPIRSNIHCKYPIHMANGGLIKEEWTKNIDVLVYRAGVEVVVVGSARRVRMKNWKVLC